VVLHSPAIKLHGLFGDYKFETCFNGIVQQNQNINVMGLPMHPAFYAPIQEHEFVLSHTDLDNNQV
jgi:hypothetical protein